MTISNLMKMAESCLIGYKTLWEKEKLLVTSNFSFSRSVFKRLVSQGRQKVLLCGKGLSVYPDNEPIMILTCCAVEGLAVENIGLCVGDCKALPSGPAIHEYMIN